MRRFAILLLPLILAGFAIAYQNAVPLDLNTAGAR